MELLGIHILVSFPIGLESQIVFEPCGISTESEESERENRRIKRDFNIILCHTASQTTQLLNIKKFLKCKIFAVKGQISWRDQLAKDSSQHENAMTIHKLQLKWLTLRLGS